MDAVEVAELTRRWRQTWPGCTPIGYLVRGYCPQRWVRLHSLPGSKRCPHTEAEYATMLHRHNTVLAELAADQIYLVSARYPDSDLAAGTEPTSVGLHPAAVHWMPATPPGEHKPECDLYVSRTRYAAGSLDALLRYVAGDQGGSVLIAGADLSWLYHPYDGGADVITPTAPDREALAHRHHDWLSTHPNGL
jgi:hypothetical protein